MKRVLETIFLKGPQQDEGLRPLPLLLVLSLAAVLGMTMYGNLREKEAEAWFAPGRPTQLMVEGELTPVGFNQYTSLSAATDLTDGGTYTIPAGAHIALIQAESQNVRWRDADYASGDTTNPTATVGMIIYAGDTLVYNGNLKAIEFIETAASATLNVSFYGL